MEFFIIINIEAGEKNIITSLPETLRYKVENLIVSPKFPESIPGKSICYYCVKPVWRGPFRSI